MNKNNMLSAAKVRVHGMTSAKWTTKDKITQYKGLIKLYTRDKKIMAMDTIIEQKKQTKELKTLQKQIDINRKSLDNAVRGDKQKLRNTLAEYREMQLAFQNAPSQKIIDLINQVNFTKRKKRDMLRYRMKLKSENLIDLKLKEALYEDRIKYEGMSWQNMLPCERAAHLITGKVQDTLLKKEAAMYIRNSYKEMISIMKKDALYFDAILASIRNDGINQGKCMINATELGQLGTEYLDDRRQEFELLEKIVKKDMASRRQDLAFVRKNVDDFAANIRHLLRRDSDINLGKVELEETQSFMTLQEDLDNIEATLKYLQKAIFTPSIESIYPCLQEQIRQKERLTEFVQKCESDRDNLLKKTKHASTKRIELENTMIETTAEYKAEKQELLQKIEEEVQRKDTVSKLIKSRYKLLADVRTSLGQLQLLARLLATGRPVPIRKLGEDQPPKKPIEDEKDGTLIIPELVTKFTKLINNSKDGIPDWELEDGYKVFETMMYERTKPSFVDAVISEESLIETVYLDAQVFSRDDIKKQSAEIVAICSVDETELVQQNQKKKKSKK